MLKQSWRPSTALCEEEFVSGIDSHTNVCNIVSTEEACINDVQDDTADCIRRKIKVVSVIMRKALDLSGEKLTSSGGAQLAIIDETASEEKYHPISLTTEDLYYQTTQMQDLKIVNRVRTRTLMQTYGWPIKFFKDIPELLTTFREAIEGILSLNISLIYEEP